MLASCSNSNGFAQSTSDKAKLQSCMHTDMRPNACGDAAICFCQPLIRITQTLQRHPAQTSYFTIQVDCRVNGRGLVYDIILHGLITRDFIVMAEHIICCYERSLQQILFLGFTTGDPITRAHHRTSHCNASAQRIPLSGYTGYMTIKDTQRRGWQYCNMAMAINHWIGNHPGHHAKTSHCQGMSS